MKNIVILLILSMIIFQSCKKEEVVINSDNRPFFELPRQTVVMETFELGSISTTIDPNYVDTSIGVAFVQNGVCATIENGYLNIGCVEPLIAPWPGIDDWRSYVLEYVGSIGNYLSSFPLENYKFLTAKIGIQIDYHRGGITELRVEDFIISSSIEPNELDGKTLHLFLDISTSEFQAYINDKNVSSQFTISRSHMKSFEIIFRAKTFIEYNQGVPYVNLSGLRIDQIEVYNL